MFNFNWTMKQTGEKVARIYVPMIVSRQDLINSAAYLMDEWGQQIPPAKVSRSKIEQEVRDWMQATGNELGSRPTQVQVWDADANGYVPNPVFAWAEGVVSREFPELNT